jgi:hypothetical protein
MYRKHLVELTIDIEEFAGDLAVHDSIINPEPNLPSGYGGKQHNG